MRWRLLAAGFAAYALALAATAPATLADAGLRNASAGRLRLAQAQGTLWSGSGALEVRDAQGHAGMAEPLAWRLRPGALLRARIVYEFAIGPQPRPFAVSLGWSGIELADAEISVPAAALGLGVPRLAPLELTGELQLRVASLAVGRDGARGSATLQWRGAGSALSPVAPLGDYELRVDSEGAVLRASVHTLQGPLQLDGDGTWANGRRPAFNAVARVPPQLQQQLAPFLRLIAVERGDGGFDLRLE
jgi:general secretion pathway protein N